MIFRVEVDLESPQHHNAASVFKMLETVLQALKKEVPGYIDLRQLLNADESNAEVVLCETTNEEQQDPSAIKATNSRMSLHREDFDSTLRAKLQSIGGRPASLKRVEAHVKPNAGPAFSFHKARPE